MKKITKIIPVVVLIIVSLLLLFYMDFSESHKYSRFTGFDIEAFSIKYEEGQNTTEIVEVIQSLAKKHNVIVGKNNVDFKNKNAYNMYLSLDNIDELKEFLKNHFQIKLLDNESSSESFISTYDQNDENQIGIINDLLGDNFYSYYLMDEMVAKNDSLVGIYYVFFKDFSNFSNFINELDDLLGYDTYTSSNFNNIANDILVLIIGCILALLLFYFIFQVYEYYNNSKKIGCMKLLGFDNSKINKNMIRNKLKIYLITMIVIVILMLCFAKNITLLHTLLIISVNLIIILLTYLISRWSCRIISKTYQITSILKKQNTTSSIGSISYVFKIIITVLIICFTIFASQNIGDLYEKLKTYNMSKDLLDYAVIGSVNISNPEFYEHDKHHDLYLSLVNNMETFYASFSDYSQRTDKDWAALKKSEEEGKRFEYASVDKNYLKKENIKVYDLDDNEVDIDTIDGVFFLFPKSKSKYIEAFEKKQESAGEYYKEFDPDYTFKAYLYDDQSLRTYRIELGSTHIDNMILRVIDDSINLEFLNSLAIQFFGYGTGTGLKIKLIDNDAEKTRNTIMGYIEEAGMSSLFSLEDILTYREYFNDEILASRLLVSSTIITIVLLLIVYTLISSQILKLYIKSQKQRILVKKLLGFDNNVIFTQIFKRSLNNSLIAIIISLLILALLKQVGIVFFIVAPLILIFDFIVITICIRSTKLSKIYLDLKGGNYD